jgi:hypothetical protein
MRPADGVGLLSSGCPRVAGVTQRPADRLGLDDLMGFVRAHGDGVLTTLGPQGEPQAAYLSLATTDRGELVLDARAAVVVGGPDGVTLQAEGLAEVVHGAERGRCADAYRTAFPQFAGSLLDPAIAVVRVRLTWARLGDYRTAAPVVREARLPW